MTDAETETPPMAGDGLQAAHAAYVARVDAEAEIIAAAREYRRAYEAFDAHEWEDRPGWEAEEEGLRAIVDATRGRLFDALAALDNLASGSRNIRA